MAIRLSGVGSGIDIESMIEGLVSASSIQLNTLQARASKIDSAVTSVSEVGTLLSSLEAAVKELDTNAEVGSYAATSDSDAIVASATDKAVQGTYEVTVDQLASAERTYSSVMTTDLSEALNLSGTLTLQVGTGDLVDPEGTLLVGAPTLSIDIDPGDTLESIVNKINAGDLRVQASTFYDGSGYRIQVSGLDVGADNDVVFDDDGLGFGFNDPGATVQAAQDALVHIDGFAVTSADNQIEGAIQGVTLALTQETDDPVKISVNTDTDALKAKIEKVVSAYNSVVDKVHVMTGFGQTKAVNSTLAADSTLRNVLSRMSSVLSQSFGSGSFNTLASIGIELNNNATISLDGDKFDAAIAEDLRAVQTVLAGSDASPSSGFMDLMAALADEMSAPGGAIDIKKTSLQDRSDSLRESVEREQTRLDNMAEQLRKTFTIMDSTVANNQAQLQYLIQNAG